MSGFDSAFHEQPVNMIGMGVGPVSLPEMNIPYGYIGPDARPCGGIGGYDAAANEAMRLQDAAWNSVPTHNIHEPYRLPDTSASLPDLPRHKPYSFGDIVAKIVMEGQESKRRYEENSMYESMTREPYRMEVENTPSVTDIIVAGIQRRRGLLTVYEQTGDSHISHVRGQGFHVTTQVPGIGGDEGLDKALAFHDYVQLDRKGLLRFNTDY